MHELPLVFFTVLGQAAAGLMILNVIGRYLLKMPEDKFLRIATVAFVIAAVAGVGALFHLGRPFRAMNSLFGAIRSPMSNEILGYSFFAGVTFMTAAVAYLRPHMKWAINAFAVLALISGVVLLYLIPQVYTIHTIPQWFTGYTRAQMVLAAFTAGGAIAVAMFPNGLFRTVAIVALVASLAMLPGYFAYLGDVAPAKLQEGMGFWGTKVALYACTLAVVAIPARALRTPYLARFAIVLVVIAELCGRIGFYDLWSINM